MTCTGFPHSNNCTYGHFGNKDVLGNKLDGIYDTKAKKFIFAKKEKPRDKDKATARGEAYVKVLNVNIDKNNPRDGYFELEWNEIFVKQLLEAGYSGMNEEEIVDAWFTTLCASTIAEEMDNG